ncbi:MAG: AraC family transcriptional regulator [Parasphingopyxis sp.]|uniref:AraC family transcriptional regulator n=1 Tax=Parasphingopyxis sp. TaxID=1920299 RepID=UPI0032EF35D9
MILSRTSRNSADPLSAVLTALGAEATRPTRLEASGDWALAFPAFDRLTFVAIVKGNCWLETPNHPSRRMTKGDVVLIGSTDYVVSSSSGVAAQDGVQLYKSEGDRVRLGGQDSVLLGGAVAFSAGSADFLLNMLPTILIVDGQAEAATAISTILNLLDRESREPQIGREAVMKRLAELMVVEGIRFQIEASHVEEHGWLAAFADPRIARALHRFHADIAHTWTVGKLAAEAGMSRSSFAAKFLQLVGLSPLGYVRLWRLTLARTRLAAGVPVAEIATKVGYSSQSAFGHAYRLMFGVSPGRVRRARSGHPRLRTY